MNTARLTRKPTTTPSMLPRGTENSRDEVGRATFTIVVSVIAINIASTNTALTVIFGLSRSVSIPHSALVVAAVGQPASSQEVTKRPADSYPATPSFDVRAEVLGAPKAGRASPWQARVRIGLFEVVAREAWGSWNPYQGSSFTAG